MTTRHGYSTLIATRAAHFALITLLGVAGGAQGNGGKIIDGKDVSPINKYPMMLVIGFSNSPGGPHCAATILNQDWGLTAGHCVEGASSTNPLYAVAGLYNFFEPDPEWAQNVSVTEIIRHEHYNDKTKGQISNDIAVFHVNPPFIFNERVAPTNLPSCDWDLGWLDKERNATAVGWGATRDPEGGRKKRQRQALALQEVDIPMRPTHACRRLRFKALITDDHLCAGGDKGEGACFGDSGGPLFEYSEPEDAYIQVGITSWGSKDCRSPGENPKPGVWTKVSKYNHWIDEAIRLCPTPRSVPDPNGR